VAHDEVNLGESKFARLDRTWEQVQRERTWIWLKALLTEEGSLGCRNTSYHYQALSISQLHLGNQITVSSLCLAITMPLYVHLLLYILAITDILADIFLEKSHGTFTTPRTSNA
jgi:hypothetical protein